MALYTRFGVGYSPTAPTEQFKLWWRREHLSNGRRRGAVVYHGAGGNYQIGPHEGTFAQKGLPLIGSDLGGGQTWGNDTSLSRVPEAWQCLIDELGVADDKRINHGGSMGSLGALLDALENPDEVACVVAPLPIVEPEQVRSEDAGGFASDIEAIHGVGTVPTAKRPLERVAEFDPSVLIVLVISENDTIGDPGLAHDFADAHPNCEAISLGSVSHSYLSMDNDAVFDLIAPHLSL